MSVVLEAISIGKVYGEGATQFQALKKVNLQLRRGEFVAIMGASGSGKSTLLNILSGLDRPTTGHVVWNGRNLNECTESELTKRRREHIGFIFQFFNLIPVLSALENVTLPLLLAKKQEKTTVQRAKQLLTTVGLEQKIDARPSEMSGGQQQRVAIARALIANPQIIVADEPTGNLDSKTSKDIMSLLRECCNRMNQSLIVVTHDAHVASYADRILSMRDGELTEKLEMAPFQESHTDALAESHRRVEEV